MQSIQTCILCLLLVLIRFLRWVNVPTLRTYLGISWSRFGPQVFTPIGSEICNVYGFATEQVLMPMIVGFSLGSATTLFVSMLLFRTGRLPFVVASIQDFFSNRHIRP